MEFKEAKAYLGEPVDDSRVRPAFAKPAPPAKVPSPDLADKYFAALDAPTRAYIAERGFTEETTARFKLGLYVQNDKRWLSIPHFSGGKTVNIKFRSLPPADKTFQRVTGAKSILFNQDCIKGADTIFLCEGETDAITLLQAGLDCVVSTTTGAGAFAPEWIDQLRGVRKIYLCYDSDDAGREGARNLAKRLGYSRSYYVELPEGIKDVNDFFQKQDLQEFVKLCDRARPFDLPGVVSFEASLDLLRASRKRTESGRGPLMTPWPSVNHLTRGFRPGNLIVVSAPAKIGKTSFTLEIARGLAHEATPVLFFCLEMRPEQLTEKVIQALCKKENITEDDINRVARDLADADFPLYFAHTFKKEKLDSIITLIREAVQRYDLRMVVFDNLHYLVRSTTNQNEEIGLATQAFKMLAEEMEIPIIALAQPRKRESSQRDEMMRAEDVKGNNSIHADCDQMIILHRSRTATKARNIGVDFHGEDESFSPLMVVRMEAHRFGGGGERMIKFIGAESRFEECQ
jgi:twinkle protein